MLCATILCLLPFFSVISAQDLVDYIPFTEEDGIELVHGPELLEVAVNFGGRIRIPLMSGGMGIAIVQEGVEVDIDCQPWSSQFEGGVVQWRRGFEDGSERERMFTAPEDVATERVVVDGRWYNISRTIIEQGAEDSDVGTYTCRVCTGSGTPAEVCSDSGVELFLAGSAPVLNKAVGDDNEPEDDSSPNFLIHRIGADFCLNRGSNVRVALRCEILPETEDRPLAFPIALRTWSKDGVEIYTATDGFTPAFNMPFLMANPTCIPGAVLPAPLDIVSDAGNLFLDTEAFNVTMPLLVPGVDNSNVKDVVFDKILGTYTCSVENEYGSDQAVSVISDCDAGTDAPETTDAATDAPEPTDAATDAPDTTDDLAPDTTEPQETTEPTTECPDVSGNLYFQLNDVMYPSGSSILITEVGAFSSATGPLNPDSSLVCMTSEVNSQCCRERDGGNVGEWHFPDGSAVLRNSENRGGDFARTGYREQVRLSRRNDALGPVGEYTCMVPREDGCGGEMHMGTISLVLPVPRSVMALCTVTVWSPPEGRFDFFSGYDVRFFIDGSDSDIIVNKEGSEFFHITTDNIRALGPEEAILVQVRAVADSDDVGPWTGGVSVGPWTDPVPLCPTTPAPA